MIFTFVVKMLEFKAWIFDVKIVFFSNPVTYLTSSVERVLEDLLP